MVRTRAWEYITLGAILVVALLLHAWNLVHTPWFYSDEGTYIYRALYLRAHGLAYPPTLAPGFTYVYGHPPGTWIFLALVFTVIQPLVGTLPPGEGYILVARAVAVALALLDCLLLFLIGRRATGRPLVGLAAAGLMAVAPLSTTWGRMALLDNFMVFWFLVSLHVALWAQDRRALGAAPLAGLALGLALLSKLPALFLLPIPFLPFLLDVPPGGERGWGRWRWALPALLASAAALAAVAALWPLYATLHGDYGRLLRGLFWFVDRNEGYTFGQLAQQVMRRDQVLTLAGQPVGLFLPLGLGGILYGFLRFRRGHLLLALPGAAYLVYLWWVHVRYAYYVAPLAPLLAMAAALPLGDLLTRIAGVRWRRALAPHPAGRAVAVALLVLLLVLPAVQSWGLAQRDDNGPGVAAAQYIIDHAQPYSIVLTNAIYQGPIQRARPDVWALYWIDDDFTALSNAYFRNLPPPPATVEGSSGVVYQGPVGTTLTLPAGDYTVSTGANGQPTAFHLDGDVGIVARPNPKYPPAILRRDAPGPAYRVELLNPLTMPLYLLSDNTVCCAGWPSDLFRVLLQAEGSRVYLGSTDAQSTLQLPPAAGIYSITLQAQGQEWRWVVPVQGPTSMVLVPGENGTAPAYSTGVAASRGSGSLVLNFRDPKGDPLPWAWARVDRLNDLVRFPGPEGDAGVLLVPGVLSLQGISPGPQVPP